MVGTRNASKSPPSSPKASSQDDGGVGRVVTPSRKVKEKEHEKEKKPVVKKSGKPKNMIAAGKFSVEAGYGQKKDTRCKMFFEFLACGIVIAYVSKPIETDEAFLMHDYKELSQNMDLKERLKIITICARRGADGSQLPSTKGSSYPFRQFVMSVYPNTHAQAKKQVKDLLNYLNNSQVESGMYKYPQRIKLMDDYTQNPRRAADTRLKDKEVVNMMVACYQCKLADLAEYDDIMAEFWSDVGYGKDFLSDYLSLDDEVLSANQSDIEEENEEDDGDYEEYKEEQDED